MERVDVVRQYKRAEAEPPKLANVGEVKVRGDDGLGVVDAEERGGVLALAGCHVAALGLAAARDCEGLGRCSICHRGWILIVQEI